MQPSSFKYLAAAALAGAAAVAWLTLRHPSQPSTSADSPSTRGTGSIPPIPRVDSLVPATPPAVAGLSEALRLAALPEGLGRQTAITAFAAGLQDPATCASIATNLALYGHALTGAALQRWVELDAPGAIRDYALKQRQRDLRVANLEWMFRDYAGQDPQAALELARGLSAEAERQTSIAATLPALAQVDSTTALRELRTLPASVALGSAAEIYGHLAAQGEPSAVFADAGQLNGTARAAAQQEVLKTTARLDPQSAVNLWHSTDNAALRHDLTRALAEGFSEAGLSPKAVADWLFNYAPECGADSVRAEFLGRLAEQDSKAAQALLEQRPVGERDALLGILANTVEGRTGLDFARQIAREDSRASAFATVAARLGAEDPQRLLAESGRDPEFARAALPAVVEALAYEQLSEATDYVQHLPAELRDTAAVRLVERLTDLSPERALEVAATTLSDPEARQQAMAAAYAASVVGRIGTAAGELPNVPAGADRDQLYFATVPLVAFRNPDSAWQVAQAIREPSLRVTALQEVLRGYAATESVAAAERRLASIELPAELAEQIRGQLGAGR